MLAILMDILFYKSNSENSVKNGNGRERGRGEEEGCFFSRGQG